MIDGNQYPVSIFVKVYLNSERGVEMPMHAIANTGKIDKARIYLLGGKVEKIIVLKNIQLVSVRKGFFSALAVSIFGLACAAY